MAECGAVQSLVKFVPVQNDVLLMAVLRLLHNLSFEVKCRDEMVTAGIIPKVRIKSDGKATALSAPASQVPHS